MLGWTAEQTLNTPMQQIELARRGRYKLINDVLGSIFGTGEPDKGKAPVQPVTDANGGISVQHGQAIGAMFASRFGARVEYREVRKPARTPAADPSQ